MAQCNHDTYQGTAHIGYSYYLPDTFSWFEGFSSHPKHVSGEMNSCVDVAVKIVMGLNPYLGEENRDLVQFWNANVNYGCTKGR